MKFEHNGVLPIVLGFLRNLVYDSGVLLKHESLEFELVSLF
jgi:hypothetical protein